MNSVHIFRFSGRNCQLANDMAKRATHVFLGLFFFLLFLFSEKRRKWLAVFEMLKFKSNVLKYVIE